MAQAITNTFCDFGAPVDLVHPQATADMLGYLPGMIDQRDPFPAKAQFDDRYRQYGGWRASQGWELRADSIKYPGDPARPLIARMTLRDEVINFYAGAWVAIVQPDGAFEVARLD